MALAAGAAGCLGIGTLYRGMAVGAMGIVAPVSAVSAVIPFAFGIGSGERPSALQVAGIVLALAGVAVASREPAERAAAEPPASGSRCWPHSASASTSSSRTGRPTRACRGQLQPPAGRRSLLALVVALTVGVSLRPGRSMLPVLAVIGLCDVGANMLFSLATTRGYLSVVAVLAALYPVVTVALAAIVLHERVARTQRLGVVGALAGAAMITAG